MPNDKPKFNKENLEVLAFLHGDPNCKRPGCYGQGFTGVTVEGVVIRCKCAVFTSPLVDKVLNNQIQLASDFGVLLRRQGDLDCQVASLSAQMESLKTLVKTVATHQNDQLIRNKIKRLFRRGK